MAALCLTSCLTYHQIRGSVGSSQSANRRPSPPGSNLPSLVTFFFDADSQAVSHLRIGSCGQLQFSLHVSPNTDVFDSSCQRCAVLVTCRARRERLADSKTTCKVLLERRSSIHSLESIPYGGREAIHRPGAIPISIPFHTHQERSKAAAVSLERPFRIENKSMMNS